MGRYCLLPLVFFCCGGVQADSSYGWGGTKTEKQSVGRAGVIVGDSSLTNCTCVDKTLCKFEDIITDGAGFFNLRRSCVPGQVCCVYPQATTGAPTGAPTQAPLTGCGVGNAGLRSGSVSVKITTDSDVVALGEFPWMVAILEADTGRFICGGSLVDERVVLTAAHCVAGRSSSTLIARLGEWDASTDTEFYKNQDLTTSMVIVHPGYYPPGVFNDLALLILSVSADLSQPHVGVSCLPDSSDTFVLEDCTVIGWGKETFNSPGISAILRKTHVPVVNHASCQSQLQNAKLGSRFRLHESFICAGGQVGQDACTGDGGGPLMCPHGSQAGRWIQIGVVSWGLECGLNVPGVYADVQSAANWIQDNINQATFRISPA